ncbi:hypothetical protein GCM10025791_24530 [Halioxenophilus aromaticivorans]|uniref:Uncharacterized protein n=1 Tax=Halioxenophilus aromaticivorans TaxID=1306992 RepID=A0AAV3U3K8_9ALTE
MQGLYSFMSSLLRHSLVLFLLNIASSAYAAEYLVKTPAEYQGLSSKLVAGDTVILSDGKWHDFEILLEGNGTPDKPITLRAQTNGNVVLTGQSNLRLAGEYLVVSGLVFRDGHTPSGAVISFRKDK